MQQIIKHKEYVCSKYIIFNRLSKFVKNKNPTHHTNHLRQNLILNAPAYLSYNLS